MSFSDSSPPYHGLTLPSFNSPRCRSPGRLGLREFEARFFGAELSNRQRAEKKRAKAAKEALKNQPKRDILGDPFSREPEDWVQGSGREPSSEPLPLGTAAVAPHKISESRTDTSDKLKKKHHHLHLKREARNFFPNQHHHPHFKREASPEPFPKWVGGGRGGRWIKKRNED